jgi:diguanylate cyclase (GGDEF)-like protein
LIGLISVDDPVDGRRPSSQQLQILELFADHAAIAIQHADMHSTLRRQQSELRHAATHDALTGVANRMLLDAEAARMSTLPNSKMTVFVIDFDHFKSVNDTGGHQAGDEVLAAIAQRIARVIRPIDLLARIGGDEFVVVVGGPDADERIDSLVRRFEEVASEPVRTAAGHFRIGASVGAVCGSTPCDFRTLLRAADADMYRRKQRGRP